MERHIRIADQARTDLLEIWDYIAQQNPAAADRLTDAIVEVYTKLLLFPYMGRLRDEIAPGLRSFPVESYLILYRVWEEAVEIIRVLHASRDIDILFENDDS